MTISSKRYGLDTKDDLELEMRLRRIESELEKLVRVSDFAGDVTTNTQRVSDMPQVTGLRVSGKTPGAITLVWNQVKVSDLRRYELDIAEDLAFTSNKQTFNVAGTEYQFNTISEEGGGGNTIIYARVRARSGSSVGPYSVTINTTTGQAQSDDIADNAVTIEKISQESTAASQTVAGIVELATDEEAAAGSDSSRAVTPHNLGQNYDNTATTGYVEIIGTNFLIQAVTGVVSNGQYLTFSKAFLDTNYFIVYSMISGYDSDETWSMTIASTTQVQFHHTSPVALTVMLFAFGKKG